jgi:hypothetical protein
MSPPAATRRSFLQHAAARSLSLDVATARRYTSGFLDGFRTLTPEW